jgi:large subunit ribosomal protein L17
MLANMASSLIIHKRIHTTVAKAKALRVYIEPLLTKAKEDNTHSRRVVFSYLQNKDAVTELFRDVSVKIAERPGGYTRIIKIGARLGDNAEMCMMELVDYNENLLGTKDAGQAKSSRRRRRGGTKKEADAPVAKTETKTEAAPEKAEEVKAETTADVKDEVIAEEAVTETPEAELAEKAEAPEVAQEEEAPKDEPPAEPEAKIEETEVKKEAPAEPEAKAEEPATEENKEEAPEAKDDEKPEDKKDDTTK